MLRRMSKRTFELYKSYGKKQAEALYGEARKRGKELKYIPETFDNKLAKKNS